MQVGTRKNTTRCYDMRAHVSSSHLSHPAEQPVLCPKPSVRTDITSKLSQVSKQAWDGEVISLRCKRRSRKIVWVFLNNTFECTNKGASSSYIQQIFKNIKGSSCLLREQGSTLHHDIQVSQRCWRVSIHGSECYMIRKEVGDLTGAVPPLIAVLKDALTA